ncbi:endonuclease 4-like [Nymphaea colorata]|nr:endonuclease 4-like [Nymphaea colorata]
MMAPRWLLIGSLVVLMQFVPEVRAWGKEGHYVVCKIAEALLSEDAANAVKALLPEHAHGELASVCSWADEIRHYHDWRWSSPLHYIDTPDFRCNYEYCRDCHDSAGVADRCVAGAIYNYTQQLANCNNPSFKERHNMTEALLFLSHFMGDIHQPLHVGFTGDLGGNTIIVHWYRRKANLHHVWDSMIIETALKEYYGSQIENMTQAIQRNIMDDWSDDVAHWESCISNAMVCPDPYATESVRLACKFAYKNATPGSTLSDAYFHSRLPVVEKRLAQGGVRLAATLNRIFAPSIKLYSTTEGSIHII